MSEYVTDEAVEKAAQALHDNRAMRSHALHEVGEPLGNTVYDNERRADARAALEAAAPLIAAQALRDAAEMFGENQMIREGDAKEWLRLRADIIAARTEGAHDYGDLT